MAELNPGKEEIMENIAASPKAQEEVSSGIKRRAPDSETEDQEPVVEEERPPELQFIPFVDKVTGKEYLNMATYEKYWKFKEPFIPEGNRANWIGNTFDYSSFCRDFGLPPIEHSIKERAGGSLVVSTPTFQKASFGFSPYLDDEGKWQNALRLELNPSPLDPDLSRQWVSKMLPEVDSFLSKKAFELETSWKFNWGKNKNAKSLDLLVQSQTPTVRSGKDGQSDYMSLKFLHPKLADGSFDKTRAIVDVWSWDPNDFEPKLLAEELSLANVAVYVNEMGEEVKNTDLSKVFVPRGCYVRAIYCYKNQWVSKGNKAEWGHNDVILSLIVANETLMSKLAAKNESTRVKKSCPLKISDV